jgi:hypothetical protein
VDLRAAELTADPFPSFKHLAPYRQAHGQATLDFGLAAACLKHPIPGDFNLIGVADVHNLLQDTGFTVRR